MSNFLIAQIRTYVPMAVGAALTWLLNYGLDITSVEGEAVMVMTAALSAIYYFLVRWGAEKWPQLGILLGVNKAPEYES